MKIESKIQKIINFMPKFFRAMKSKETPKLAKLIGFSAIAYAIMPADLIADYIPILGLLDDAIVLPILLYISSSMIPENIMEDGEMKREKVRVRKDNVIEVDDYKVL